MEKKFIEGKIFVKNETNKIQNLLFQLGYRWAIDNKTISCKSYPFIFFGEDGYITVSTSPITFYETFDDVKEYTIDDLQKLINVCEKFHLKHLNNPLVITIYTQ